jgi:DNA-binding MarR family transcriptional regulator
MDDLAGLSQRILDLDIRLQRQIYAGWPESWVQVKWPVGAVRALLIIESGFARAPHQVAAVLKVSRTTVTGMLDRLVTDGLITRSIDPRDRRSFVLDMTDTGRELVRQIDALRRSQLEHALTTLDKSSLQALHQGLESLTHAMDVCRELSEAVIEEEED